MAQINRQQTFERDEDFGGGYVTQKCEYNSVSDWIKVHTDGQELSLPKFEWSMLVDLINETVGNKGLTL